MQVVFLAGGRATRLGPFGGGLPKALQPVAGLPLLDRLLAAAAEFGLSRTHLCLGHLHELILEHLRGRGVPFTYSLDDLPGGAGTAGALRTAEPHLEDSFMIWLADTIPVGAAAGPALPPPSAVASMLVAEEVPGVTPNVVVADGRVVRYDKGGPAGARFVDAGLYSAHRSLLRYLPPGKVDLEELWPRLIELGLLHADAAEGTFLDIGTPERLAKAEAVLTDGLTHA